MPAYHRETAKESRAFRQFRKYVLRGKHYSEEEQIRYFFSRAEGTVILYTNIVKSYVRYMRRQEKSDAFPVTETSLRRYIGQLDIEKDKGKFATIKPAMVFLKKVRNEPETSFSSTDLILEGLIRETGARFKPRFKASNFNDLNIRKVILRGLYGKSFKQPYNKNMIEFRTGLRCLTSLFCLSRCQDYMELKRIDIKFEADNVIIDWRKRKNNQRSKSQQSLVPRLPDHPLCLFSAFEYYCAKTQLKEDQFINCKMTKNGKPGDSGIARSTCYANINSLCKELKIDPITEKICKSLGTRYLVI